MTEIRQTALSCVRRATEELRETVDVLLRLTAAIQNTSDAEGVKSAASDLRAARRRMVAAARDAQKRIDDIGSIEGSRAGRTRRRRPGVSTMRSRARAPSSP